MDFRTVVLLALWTLLSGPILATPPAHRAIPKASQFKTAPAYTPTHLAHVAQRR